MSTADYARLYIAVRKAWLSGERTPKLLVGILILAFIPYIARRDASEWYEMMAANVTHFEDTPSMGSYFELCFSFGSKNQKKTATRAPPVKVWPNPSDALPGLFEWLRCYRRAIADTRVKNDAFWASPADQFATGLSSGFCNDTRLGKTQFNAVLQHTIKAVGMRFDGISLYSLRSVTCSLLADSGMNVFDIRQRTGHKTVKGVEAYLTKRDRTRAAFNYNSKLEATLQLISEGGALDVPAPVTAAQLKVGREEGELTAEQDSEDETKVPGDGVKMIEEEKKEVC